MLRRVFQVLGAVILVGLLAVGGCQFTQLKASQSDDTSRWEQVQEQVEQTAPAATAQAALAGSQFNRFFPSPSAGYERVYTQEKTGFAEAKLQQDGQVVAMLSVSDTATNPSAASKYQDSAVTIGGYPSAEIGNTATGLLINNRLQVKVLSRADSFTADDRAAWLEKFDLAGLAGLVSQY